MAATLSSEIKASLAWLLQDTQGLTTVADASRLEFAASLNNGSAAGQANALWHDLRTLAAGANDDLVLSALSHTLFGSAITTALTAVKGILIVNTATLSGEDLIVGAAAANAWSAPFGGAAHQARVPAGASLLLVNTATGWPVAAGVTDVLRIASQGAGVIDYKIAVVGLHA